MNKIVFLRIFLFSSIMFSVSAEDHEENEEEVKKPLDLVSDDQLSYSHEDNFNKARFLKKIEDISKSYENCLEERGIKESSFNICVGKGYRKINRDMYGALQQAEAALKENFAHDLSPICKEKVALCSDLIDTLNLSFVRFEDPIAEIKKQSEEYSISGKEERELSEAIGNLDKNYKEYKVCEDTVEKSRQRTLNQLEDFIESSGIPVTFDYEPEDISREEKEDKPNEDDFHENLAKMEKLDLLRSFEKVNGPIATSKQEKMLIIL
jgi:hypothetical protein